MVDAWGPQDKWQARESSVVGKTLMWRELVYLEK